MSRFSVLLAITVALAAVLASPAYSQPALESGLPLEVLILRIDDDQDWYQGVDADGAPLVWDGYQLQAGVAQVELTPPTLTLYQEQQVQDVYIYRTMMYNAHYDPVATMVEIRIMTFPDDDSATTYLAGAYDQQVAAGESAVPPRQYAPIDPLPVFETPITGWTEVVEYVDNTNEAFSGLASSVRYLTQIDRSIVSVKVTGPFVDFNFDFAHGLLGLQAECMNYDGICSSVVPQIATDAWLMHGDGVLYFPSGVSDLTPARWIWPVQEPVRAPEMSESISAAGT